MKHLTDTELATEIAYERLFNPGSTGVLSALLELQERRKAAKPRCFYCKRVNDNLPSNTCSQCVAHYRAREGA